MPASLDKSLVLLNLRGVEFKVERGLLLTGKESVFYDIATGKVAPDCDGISTMLSLNSARLLLSLYTLCSRFVPL